MATIDSVNVSLSGQTGTGSFVGSDSPTFTTNISTPNLQFTANTITATNTNGSVIFAANGTGIFQFNGNSTAAGTIRLLENSGNGTTYTALKAAESISSSVTFTLPTADGTNGQALTTNGSAALSFTTISGGSGGLTGVHYYTGSTTWTKPAGLTHAYVLCLGGGGAGGSCIASTVAGGGGGGSYGWSYIAAASLSSTETVTIGAGGTPGAAGNHPGGNGGTTSFGTHISAGGGTGAVAGAGSAGAANLGGAGGTCTSADINIPGNTGLIGYNGAASGAGGMSTYGAFGAVVDVTVVTNANGNAGTGYGAGGSGGGTSNSTTKAGGAGAPGLCLVYEYT